jgi:hypothetical protein
MTTRKYSSRSQQTTLTAAVTSGATVIPVANATTLLGGATVSAGQTFTIVIDPDTALEEIVEITSASSNNLTVTRAVDMSGAAAQDHSAGAIVRHMIIGRDLREANLHIEASGGYNDGTGAHALHGLAVADGAVVGTDAVQTLTNKTLISPVLTGTLENDASITFEGATADAFETTLTVVDPTADRTITLPNTSGTVVLKDSTDTLTNKTLTSPTISGAPIITGLSSAGMSASSAAPKDYVDSILGSATAASTSAASAATSASSAATSASSALTSQTAASTSATSAAASATAAATSATSAAASATAATTSATSASVSATTAATSASSAATSATSAAASVSSIAGYATTASNSASAAATSASSAATSATSAAASATAATTSASSAATSATAAAASATAAATSATSAAASATAAAAAVTSAIQLTTIDVKGDLIVGTANDTASRLGVGTNSQILTADSTATTGLKWADAPAGYTAPTLGSTTIASGSTVSNVNGLTINSTTIPTSKTISVTTDKISAHAATTSAELAGVISDETGTGSLVFATTPTLVTPVLGAATATSINGTTIPTSKTLVATDSTAYVVPTQTGNSGKYLTTDGTTSSWGTVAGALAQPTEPASPTDGQIWIDTDGTAPTTVVTRWTKQPAAGTTSLTGNDDYSIPLAYSAGYEQVFLNGVLLSRTAGEYTATSGTAITLAAATVASDIVEVICPLQIATTDTYTQSAVNNAFVANTGYFAAGKNCLINGGFDIWQRGTTAASGYLADRWFGTSNAGTQTFSQSTDVPASPYFTYSMSMASTTGTNPQIQQKIESANSTPFAGRTVVVSFYAKSTAGTNTLTLYTAYPTVADTWGAETQDVTTTFTLTSAWVRYSYSYTMSANAIKGYKVVLYRTDTVATSTTLMTGVQVELGATATTFSRAGGTIQGELAACQRYYLSWVTGTTLAIGTGFYTAAATLGTTVPFPVTMRITPSLIVATGTNYYRFERNSANDDFNSFTIWVATPQSTGMYNNSEASGTAGQAGFIYTNNASASIAFSAEL